MTNAKEINLDAWRGYVDSLDFDPLFVTVSGAHLYGFPSVDSDVDLRGCHQLPLREIVGLKAPQETIDRSSELEGIEVDIVSHDIGKYFALVSKNNGYVLEQIFSPIVVRGGEFLEELRSIAARCITRHHYHHYRGFYGTQRKLIEKMEAKTAKAVLYAYRVLMTGIHLMRTGRVEANILVLNEDFKLDAIPQLIDMKVAEKVAPPDLEWDFHAKELDRLEDELGVAYENTKLSEARDWDSLNEFLIRRRLESKQ